MKNGKVTAEQLATYIVNLAEGRKANNSEIQFVADNFDNFEFTFEEDFVTKEESIQMTREQLDNNCDLLNI